MITDFRLVQVNPTGMEALWLCFTSWDTKCTMHTDLHTQVMLLYLDSIWQRDSLLNFSHLYQVLVLDVLLDHYAWLTRQNLHLYEKQMITYSIDIW